MNLSVNQTPDTPQGEILNHFSDLNCSQCFKHYDLVEQSRTPIQLSCQHVICFTCFQQNLQNAGLEAQYFICSMDNCQGQIAFDERDNTHQGICERLQKELKDEQSLLVHCVYHPDKRASYVCLPHNQVVCAQCCEDENNTFKLGQGFPLMKKSFEAYVQNVTSKLLQEIDRIYLLI